MTAAIRDSIHKLLTGVVHLWLTQHYLDHHELPGGSWTSWVYTRHLGWGADLLRGRRVRVTIEVEEDPS